MSDIADSMKNYLTKCDETAKCLYYLGEAFYFYGDEKFSDEIDEALYTLEAMQRKLKDRNLKIHELINLIEFEGENWQYELMLMSKENSKELKELRRKEKNDE